MTDGIGFNTPIWWKYQNYYVGLDEVSTRINEENIRLYFWDLNLPGELRTKVYSQSGYTFVLKVLYDYRKQIRIGARIWYRWNEWYPQGTPGIEGALLVTTSI